jgi:cysteinyl-tRNA synthetase
MNDDFNTAKVLASMFELVPIINSIKDKLIDINTIQSSTITLIQQKFKSYLEDIFGLLPSNEIANSKLNEVMNLLIEIRKEAKIKKDFATSDKIRNQLTEMGINLKDEKGGEMTWSL